MRRTDSKFCSSLATILILKVMSLRDFDPEMLPPHTPVQTVDESATRNRYTRVGMPGDISQIGTSGVLIVILWV